MMFIGAIFLFAILQSALAGSVTPIDAIEGILRRKFSTLIIILLDQLFLILYSSSGQSYGNSSDT